MPRTFDPRPLLLDTHIWLWLVLGTGGLSSSARSAIVGAATVGNLRISAITLWEVALLASRRRVAFGKPTLQWIDEAIVASFVAVEPLSPDIAVETCELPGAFHADPADRMIVATARVTNATLLTRDQKILDYAGRGHLDALAA